MDFEDRRLLMILEFSDRQLEVRLSEDGVGGEGVLVRQLGSDIVGRHEDWVEAIRRATSLPLDVVTSEFGLAFPIAAARFGGTSGIIELVPLEPRKPAP